MAGRTLSEKILSAHAGRRASGGELVVCEADLVLGTDGSTPMALDYYAAMGGGPVRHPDRIFLARDHYAPAITDATRGFHARMEAFAAEQGVELLPVGGGIGFQVALERGRVDPGDLVVGADSHTVMCGAVGAFATGIGSADLAGAFRTGKVWLRVPETFRVVLDRGMPSGVGAKDVALELLRAVGSEGCAYAALEFHGSGADALPLEERMVLSNMSAEAGAKAGLFSAGGLASDPDARFAREVRLDLRGLEPTVALPHEPAHGVGVTEVVGTRVDWVFLGTCTGGRVHDFREALRVLDVGGGIAPGVTVVAALPTANVRDALDADGTLARLRTHGVVVSETGCGPCCGTSGPLPPLGARVISTANRNFRGRMGDPSVTIWLASPATCAAAATAGRIVDPREMA